MKEQNLHLTVEEMIERLEHIVKMIEEPAYTLEFHQDREILNRVLEEIDKEGIPKYDPLNPSLKNTLINLTERIKKENSKGSNWHVEFINELVHIEEDKTVKAAEKAMNTSKKEPEKGMLETGQYLISKEEQIANQKTQLIKIQTISKIREALKNMAINGRENTITDIKKMVEEAIQELRELEEQYQKYHEEFEVGASNRNGAVDSIPAQSTEISMPRNNIFSRIAKTIGNGFKWIGGILKNAVNNFWEAATREVNPSEIRPMGNNVNYKGKMNPNPNPKQITNTVRQDSRKEWVTAANGNSEIRLTKNSPKDSSKECTVPNEEGNVIE